MKLVDARDLRADALRERLRRRAPRRSAGEQAAAEERAFQRAIAVHAAAAKAGDLADRIEAGDDGAAGAEDARVEISLEAAERLAGQDVEAHGDQRAMGGIENAMRRRGADQLVAEEPARIVDAHHLRVLGEGIG